jgi:hypothetical protein
MSTDAYGSEVVNPNSLAYPSMSTDVELPRIFDIDAGLDYYPRAYFCPK